MKEENKLNLRLGKKNLIAISISVVIILIGYVLMMVGPVSTDGNFEPDIFSTRRLIIGPMIVFFGYLSVIIAILYKKNNKMKYGCTYNW